jgi:hypothetical protein
VVVWARSSTPVFGRLLRRQEEKEKKKDEETHARGRDKQESPLGEFEQTDEVHELRSDEGIGPIFDTAAQASVNRHSQVPDVHARGRPKRASNGH